AKTGSLQALIEQVNQHVMRLADSGGGQFQLEWGEAGREQVRVEVALREGRWHVEFRSANPEVTRFLEREWERAPEARQLLSEREADVAFSFDDSGSDRQQDEPGELSSAEAL